MSWDIRSTSEIIGNQRSIQAIKHGFLSHTIQSCLISGAPGIGKTLSARLIAQECGFRPIFYDPEEMDASIMTGLLQRQIDSPQPPMVIFDGIEEIRNITKMIKDNRGSGLCCICISGMPAPKPVKSAVDLALQFYPPDKGVILFRLKKVFGVSHVEYEGDVRSSVIKASMESGLVRSQVPNIFEARNKLLTSRPGLSVSERFDLLAYDYGFLDTLVAEKVRESPPAMMMNTANALDCLSFSDTVPYALPEMKNATSIILPAAYVRKN